jgi:pilus assembly protein CpaB
VVTLLVTPQDAERISLAASEGQITLTLRNPLDVARTQTTGVRMANLLAEAAPPPVMKKVEGHRVLVQPKPVAAPAQIYTVETIRAAKRSEEAIR